MCKTCTEHPKPGDAIFIERPIDALDENGKGLSNYDAGQYIVIKAGASTVIAVKPGSGYDLHNTKNFPLVGRHRWEIISCDDGRELVEHCISVLEDFEVERNATKKQWVDSVYVAAETTLRRLRMIARDRWGVTGQTSPPKFSGNGVVLNGAFFPCPPGYDAVLIKRLDAR